MNRHLQFPALLLAAVLQLLPLCRAVCLHPAAQSAFVIVCRWIAPAAAFGAVHAVSGASPNPVTIDSATNATAAVGSRFLYFITLGGDVGKDPGAVVSAAPLPAGLSNFTYDGYADVPVNVYGVITGVPTTAVTNFNVTLIASHTNAPTATVYKTLFITVIPSATAVTITNEPVSLSVITGATASLTVAASGTPPLTYQWFKSNTNISSRMIGATNATYTITNAQTNHAGTYLVRVIGPGGSAVSTPATLTVTLPAPPAITTAPTDLTAVAGQPAVLTVAASGTGPLNYHWHKNGTNFPGATSTNLIFQNVRLADAGGFCAIVTNAYGSVTSAPNAKLTVLPPPPPVLGPPVNQAGQFIFSFTPVVGLTNTVLTNAVLGGGAWIPLTNFPPPASSNSLSITDSVSGAARFYRVQVLP